MDGKSDNLRVIGLVKNFSKLFSLDALQGFINKMIALLMIFAIIVPIISSGNVYDYIALFTLVSFFLNSHPSVVISTNH
jgi:hypothetical protein